MSCLLPKKEKNASLPAPRNGSSISALRPYPRIIYWTVYVSADVMWKHGLYIMTVFCMTLVIYPFEKAEGQPSPLWTGCSSSQHRRFGLRHLGVSGSLHAAGHVDGNGYLLRCLMLFLGLEVGRRSSAVVDAGVHRPHPLFAVRIRHPRALRARRLRSRSGGHAGLRGHGRPRAFRQDDDPVRGPFHPSWALFWKSPEPGISFIRLAFALTRNTVGGPAKAAVIGSALLGSISGSAVANVSSTGVLTIPMMKKVGYRPHVAGAIRSRRLHGRADHASHQRAPWLPYGRIHPDPLPYHRNRRPARSSCITSRDGLHPF